MARVELDKEKVRLAAMGPALKLVSRACRIVQSAAKRRVRVDTGRLKTSINTKITMRLYTINGKVGSRVKYGLVEHQGAKRHAIRPVRGRYLKFYWKKVGKVVWLRRVDHPGTKGSFYLTIPLAAELPKRGFKVTLVGTATGGGADSI